MSTKTTNYSLVKPDLTDSADITAMNGNWDTIDTELKKKADISADGKIPASQLPPMDYIPNSQKGVASGVATLGTDGKVPASQLSVVEVTGAASTIQTTNLTTNRALISNGSGKVAVSPVTSTELGYLDGVTSGVQTQLNNKLSTTGGVLTGPLSFQNKDDFSALGKFRTINSKDYFVNYGCGQLGGEGIVCAEVHLSGSVIGRLEVGRLGVSYQDENGKRTYLHRTSAVPATVES